MEEPGGTSPISSLAVLMDSSKAFDTINHNFLVTKLHAYGFSYDSFKLL